MTHRLKKITILLFSLLMILNCSCSVKASSDDSMQPDSQDQPTGNASTADRGITPLKGGKITISSPQEYDGSAKKPEITVTLKNQSGPLVKDRDYTVSYTDNIQAGKATVTVTGCGQYEGMLKKSFKIAKCSIDKASGFDQSITAVYEKGGVKPTVTLTFCGNVLEQGKDYTITYKRNTSAASKNPPAMTIKGKNNFRGTKTINFTITKKALNDSVNPVTISAADIIDSKNTGKYKSTPVLTDSNGKKLKAGKDYTIDSYVSKDSLAPLGKNDKVFLDGSKSKKITVTVSGRGNYREDSNLSFTYKIKADASVDGEDADDTGSSAPDTGKNDNESGADGNNSVSGNNGNDADGNNSDSGNNESGSDTDGSNSANNGNDSANGENGAGSNDTGAGNTGSESRKILVAYFSMTGNSERLAKFAAEITGADIYKIEAAEPYTSEDLDYGNADSRTSKEQNDASARPAISGKVENMDAYDRIILAYPIWWGQAPRIIYTFLESYDFSGKTILPFCTSASSGIGSSAKNLEGLCGSGVTWLSGERFASSASKNELESWIKESGIMNQKENTNADTNADKNDVRKEETEKSAILKITVGENEFLADFADNSSAAAFQELLEKGPLTVSMSDYGNFEKVGSLGTTLPRNDKQITTSAGDVILYQGNQITIYYDTNSWSFTRLAKIRNRENLKKKLGSGKVTAVFSLEYEDK